jgi:hypothetical protein
LLLKILNDPILRFSDFDNFQNSDTSGSLIFEIKPENKRFLTKSKNRPILVFAAQGQRKFAIGFN